MADIHRKKIAVVIPKYGLIGGAEGFAAEMTERLALNPLYDMHVFANRWQQQSDRITFHRVPVIAFPKFLTTVSFAAFANRLISGGSFDLIHAHDRIFNAHMFTMHGVPHAFWVREIRRKKWPSLFDRATSYVEKKLVNNPLCQRYLSVSNLAREIFLREYRDADPAKTLVMRPGIEMSSYRNLNREECRREIRRRFSIGMSESVILFVSMNFDIKGLDHIIAALAGLKNDLQRAPFRLLIVGKGNRHKYSAMARALGIEEQLVFTGIVDKKDLNRIYMASDIYAMLSEFDTFGMVVLEAMAASLPVMVSRNVGAKDLIRDGVNGYVISDAADARSVAEKIGLMLDEDRRTDMGKYAFQTAADNSWDAVAKDMEAIYEKTLAGQ